MQATDSDSPEEECPVCQEPMSQQKVAVLPCKHSFHSPCLREWLCRKATCPTYVPFGTACNLSLSGSQYLVQLAGFAFFRSMDI